MAANVPSLWQRIRARTQRKRPQPKEPDAPSESGPFRRFEYFQLPQKARELIFDMLVDESLFKPPQHPPFSHPPYFLPIPHFSTVSYVQKIPPVSKQYYEEYIQAVCRKNPRCGMFVTIRDSSVARYDRARRPYIFRREAPSFYPGHPVMAEVVLRKVPTPYLQHIRDLKLFCVIDRSDMGTNMHKLRTSFQDTTPSIEGALRIREKLPSLQKLEIQIYLTVRDVYGYNYSMAWIDDRIKPLMVLPQSTIVRLMIPVTDTEYYDVNDPSQRRMLIWRACPGGPDAADWSHYDHGERSVDISGARYCYRCLRENQDNHRSRRLAHGWTTRPAESTFFQTLVSRTTDEETGAQVDQVHHRVDPPRPSEFVLLDRFIDQYLSSRQQR